MRILILAVCVLGLFSACSTEELVEEAKIDTYFDLEGTLNKVVDDLVAQNAQLKKSTAINEQEEQAMLALDSAAAWKAQLEVFYESDINKVGLSNSYSIDTTQAFDGIKKVVYEAFAKSAYVKSMECSFRDGKLFLIRILASDKNVVYSISNEYYLYFNHFKRKLALDHFSIHSQKKIILRKDLDIVVAGEVILP